jgi:iron complex outermembrane recepter protein
MFFQPTLIHRAVAVALTSTFGVASLAQTTTTPPPPPPAQQQVEKIEVTGSNIKRIDVETVAPVTVITRDQIERSGQITVGELLRNIPANSGGSFGESFSNSFAPGAAGISLRGLGQKATLVLLNGRRTANYGFAQNLQDSFVDLNSIPTAAIERIEVLRDGASAIYGSDAIAGVVNVIFRRDYKGVEGSVQAGSFEGKNDIRGNVVAGVGDLGKDRWNAFGVLDFYKRDLLQLSETDFGSTRDFRGEAGGRNFTSLTGAGTWRQLSATNALTPNQRAIASCPGKVLTGPEAVQAGLIAAPLGNTAFNIAGNTFCSKDFNDQFTALPGTQRIGFVGRGNMAFGNGMTGYAELGLSRIETDQKFQSAFFAGTTGLQPTSAGLRPFTYNINFAPGSAGNPFNSNARYVGVLGDVGTRDTEISSNTMRVLAGLKYGFANWDADSAVGFARNEVESLALNRLSKTGVSAAFGVPTTPQPPIPVSTTSTYNLNDFGGNSAAARAGLLIDVPRKSDSELRFIDTKASTEFGQLAGGPIGLALGAEYRAEELKDQPAKAALDGDILGQGTTATNGKRNSTALYGELNLPINNVIEAQLAVRHDRYSDFGNTTNPKIGVKFKLSPQFLLRANYGTGFRAPSLPEISPSTATFFTSVQDPLNNNAITQISGVFAGNPDLLPETSKGTTVGIIFEPSKDFNVSFDIYDLRWKNIVGSPSFQSIVNSGDPTRVIRDPANNNAIVTVLSNYGNLASTNTKGVDFDMRYRLPATAYGRFAVSASGSYIDSFKEDGVEYVDSNAGSNTIPRFRGSLSLGWDYEAFSATLSMNYIQGWKQELLPASYFTEQDPQFQTGVYPDRTRSHTTFDLFGRYRFNNKLTLSASVLNLTGELPPYDPGFSGTSLYDFSQYDVRGRIFRVGVAYKF